MITPEQSRSVAVDSVRHLLGLIEPGGQFIYAHRLNAVDDRLPGYNILRHCGTLWYLCKAVRALGLPLRPEERERLGAAIRYIEQRLTDPPWTEGVLPRLCLPENGAVKLGANGLALLMLHEFAGVLKKTGDEPGRLASMTVTLARLENYILSQMSGGDFIHKRSLSGGAILPFRSNFYTGEAIFGLARGKRFPPGVVSLLHGLMGSGYGIDVQSHWMCHAACEALEKGLMEPAPLARYIARLVGAIVSEPGYRARRQSTPIACRTEALVRFLLVQRASALRGVRFEAPLVQAARQAAEENLALQLTWHSAGQFHKGDGDLTVQIDDIQHNAMSFLMWHLLTADPSGVGLS